MREILFRGKRKDNSEWVEGYYADVAKNNMILTGRIDITETIGAEMFRIIPETVGQYTGLTDKNGKKIFEGDIVNCVYDGDLRTYIVVWDKEELDFKAISSEESYRHSVQYLCCCDEVEIISNTFDNPELMDRLNGRRGRACGKG